MEERSPSITKQITLRPELFSFVFFMEEKLKKFDSKRRHHSKESMDYLFIRLVDEVGELAEAVLSKDKVGVIEEAVDVANFAMFLADNAVKE